MRSCQYYNQGCALHCDVTFTSFQKSGLRNNFITKCSKHVCNEKRKSNRIQVVHNLHKCNMDARTLETSMLSYICTLHSFQTHSRCSITLYSVTSITEKILYGKHKKLILD